MAAIANSSKKRKVDVEGRLFKASWTVDYFVMERFGRIMCLICQETISVPKEYNVKRHFLTKHGDRYDSLTGQVRLDRVNSLQQSVVGQQSLFTAVSKSSEASTKVSFLLAEAIAKRGKAFSDGEFVKECLGLFTSVVCPEKKSEVEKISLSHQTVARRVDELSSNIEGSLAKRLAECEFYSLALDESTDISDTAQLSVFVRGVTEQFVIIEELLDLCSMQGTTTGRDILVQVKKVLTKFNLPETKLIGLTTDGAPAMTGRHNGFVSLMVKGLPHKIVSHHCIIHQYIIIIMYIV